MLTTLTLRQLAQITKIRPEDFERLPSVQEPDLPVPEQLIVVDESIGSEECILDGRKRYLKLHLMALKGIVSWDLEIPVQILNIRQEMAKPIPTQLDDLPTGILNISYIRNFLLLRCDPNSEKALTQEKLEDLVRGIYRHLMNSLRSDHSNTLELIGLVADLNSYLKQADIAKILRRSEAWVSDTVAVSKLPLHIISALETGQIFYSAAVIVARAESEKERNLLFALAKELDVRVLRDVFRYLLTKPNFASKKDALERLLNMFSKKVLNVGGRARFHIQAGIERSKWKLFRSRLRKNTPEDESLPGKDPQSLVFRLKIIIDGENAHDLTKITPEMLEKIRKPLVDSLKESLGKI